MKPGLKPSSPAIMNANPNSKKSWPGSAVDSVVGDPNTDWDATMHRNAGNIGLGDGSAQQINGVQLRKQISTALQNGSVDVYMQFP